MKISDAKNKWCPLTFAAGEVSAQPCCTTHCMAWEPNAVRETKIVANASVNKELLAAEGWLGNNYHSATERSFFRYVNSTTEGSCGMLPKECNCS